MSSKRTTRRARRTKPAATAPDAFAPSDLLLPSRDGTVRVAGRVVAVRASTVVLADALDAVEAWFESAPEIAVGDLVVVDGRWRGGGLRSARVVECRRGEPPAHGTEFGRLAGGDVGRNLAARAVALRVVRDYFDARGFVEVETPVRVPSPGLDAYVDAVRSEDRWLITSPELSMKRLLVGGMPRIYQLCRATRAGEHGAWHEGEFTMLEWYRAFSTMDAVIADTEELVASVVRALSGKTKVRAPPGNGVIDVAPPFMRTTVREAFRRHAGVDDAVALAAKDRDRYFQTFVDSVEPGIARSKRPVVLTEFPTSEGALARPCPHDPSVCERFEVYVGDVELSNGFGELTDPVEQRRRFESEQSRRRRAGAPDHPIDERFLEALREGMPPSGGNALGFDRLVALALGANGIAEVMAFPRERL